MREVARREALLADLALVGVTAVWGSTFIVNRLVLDSAPPLAFLALRFGVATAVLLPLAVGRPRSPRLLADSAFVGLLLAAGIGFQIVGQLFTTASKAAFVTGLSVPLTPVVGLIVTRKKPSAENMVGLVIATIGFAVLSWPTDAAGVNVGDVLVLGTAVTYALIIVRMGEAASRHDVRWFTAGQTAFAAVGVIGARLLVAPLVKPMSTFAQAEARPLPWSGGFLAAVAWMALIATVATFLVQTWAQARMQATHAAILFALEPVWTALFAALILSERMRGRDYAGAGLVLAGILVSELRRNA